MSTSKTYWIAIPGSNEPPMGPLGLEEIATKVRAGSIPKDATASEVGLADWTSVEKIVPKMADQFMVFVPGSSSPPQGPVELDELTRRFHGSEIPPGAKVARVGDTTWLPIEQVVPRLIEEEAKTIVETPEVVVPQTYEVTVDGEHVVGPVTLDQLRRGFEVGKLPADAKVRVVGEVTWYHILDLIQTEPRAAKLDLTVPSPSREPTPPAPTRVSTTLSKEGPKKTPLSRLALVGVGLTLVVALGMGVGLRSCGKGQRLIEDAKRDRAAGKNEIAYLTLRKVADAGSNKIVVQEAAELGASWLVEDADRAPLGDQEKLLTAAIKWAPTNGPAQARLCRLFATQGDFPRLRSCLDADLAKKTAVPSDIVEDARRVLLDHDRSVAEAAERERWLASTDIADWKRLVQKYPTTKEAEEATAKIEHRESFCREYAMESFTEFLLPLDAFAPEVVHAYEAAESGNSERGRAKLKSLLRTIVGLKVRLSVKCEEVRAHATRSGEESIKRETVAACGELEKHYGRWESAVSNFDGLEPFVALKADNERVARQAVGDKTRFRACRDLASKKPEAQETRSPSTRRPDPPSPCGCNSGDLMCNMQCSAARRP